MPNPKLETYKNKATGDVYDFTDADAQGKLTAILDGTTIDSFSDVESALADKVDVVSGKGLSTNDYDNTAKGIVDNIQSNVIANTKLIKDTVGWSGKNKLPFKYASSPNTNNGITWTVNSDHTVTASGISTGNSTFTIVEDFDYIPNKYIGKKLTGCPSGGSNSGYKILVDYSNNGTTWTKSNDEIGEGYIIENYPYINIKIYISNGMDFSTPKTFKPMLRDADILDSTYEPYFGSTAFPRSEQTVLGARNLWRFENIVRNQATYTEVNNGLRIQSSQSDTYCYVSSRFSLPHDTNLIFSTEVTKTSGDNFFVIDASNDGTNWTKFYESAATGEVKASFNTGNFAIYRIRFFATLATAAVGDVTFANIMIRLASDKDDTFSKAVLTNDELTDAVTPVNGIELVELADGIGGSISNESYLYKFGKLVVAYIQLLGITASMNDYIMTLPEGYRPRKIINVATKKAGDDNLHLGQVMSNGNVQIAFGISNANYTLLATSWVTQ